MSKDKKVLDLLANLEIAAIQLVSTNFSVNLPPEVLPPELVSFGFEHQFNFATGDVDNKLKQLFCFVDTILIPQFNEKNEIGKTLKEQLKMSAKCKYVVRYLVKPEAKFDDEVLGEFSKQFAIAHVYPYIRNHIDLQFREMGLTSLALPIYKQASQNSIIKNLHSTIEEIGSERRT